ncbi:MAG: efflux RND transporter periplasmic adaptor subunit [Oligosphaeraceae bacterium]|nr:efflux RND transporter periplasmic adaptor subunit [Oligosphaeraceae bacterium]
MKEKTMLCLTRSLPQYFIKTGLFATLLVGTLLFVSCKQEQQEQSDPVIPVSTVTMKTGTVTLYSELPGRVSALLLAEIRPQVNGILLKRHFIEGAEVKEGDLLYEIDPAPYQAAVANAEAAVSLAKAQQAGARANSSRANAGLVNAESLLKVAEAGLESSRATVTAAETALAAAIAGLDSAQANVEPLLLRQERFKELLESKAISQQDYDDVDAACRKAQAAITVSQARVDGAKADLARAEAGLKVAIAEVDRAKAGLVASQAELEAAAAGEESAKAAVQSATAGLAAARINLDYTRITAPISGRIGKSNITVGALVSAHQPVPLARIQQIDKVYVDVPQATADMLKLQRRLQDGRLSHNGTQHVVKLNLEDGKPYSQNGSLQFKDISVDPSTGTYNLRMQFPNPDRILLPGMFVRALIEEGVKEEAILLPQSCVSRDARGNPTVFVVDSDETAQVRSLTLDRGIQDKWLVSSGLSAGDRVIIEGLQRLRPGLKVRETPAIAPGNNSKQLD